MGLNYMANLPDDLLWINPKYYPSKIIPENSALVFTGIVRTSIEIINNKLVMKIWKDDLKYVRLVRPDKDETREDKS